MWALCIRIPCAETAGARLRGLVQLHAQALLGRQELLLQLPRLGRLPRTQMLWGLRTSIVASLWVVYTHGTTEQALPLLSALPHARPTLLVREPMRNTGMPDNLGPVLGPVCIIQQG